MCSIHLFGNSGNKGAGTNFLQSGQGNPTGAVFSLLVVSAYESRHFSQNVWRQGRHLGILKESKQIGHTVKFSIVVFFVSFDEAIPFDI
jgi:hypothetical protein